MLLRDAFLAIMKECSLVDPSWRKVTIGMLQSSVFCLQLFKVFINDFVKRVAASLMKAAVTMSNNWKQKNSKKIKIAEAHIFEDMLSDSRNCMPVTFPIPNNGQPHRIGIRMMQVADQKPFCYFSLIII